MATSLEECKRRDPKGLYKKVERGDLKGFTGVDDPYETPAYPEVRIETMNRTVKDCADEILRATLSKKPKVTKPVRRDLPLTEFQ